MVSRCSSVAFKGIEVVPVDVQVQISGGMPAFMIVGLPDKAVAESRERVRSAINAIGLALPAKRIVVNLAPADLAKEGSYFDLPIALALLMAMEVLPIDAVDNCIAMGELALDGHILPVNGVLPAAIAANSNNKGLICPRTNGPEAAWAGDITILPANHLLDLINHIKGQQTLPIPQRQTTEEQQNIPDLQSVKGQESARRALEIAAAGGHNMLMSGTPGAGKSMLASCLPGILPPLQPAEMLELSIIKSVAGELAHGRLSQQRPFRDPHHSSSQAAMVGGGRKAMPGEISLAHKGVLFLDELPEFPRAVLEALRQPLETGKVSVARAQAHVTYPAEFQLIAAMNPCRCGYLSDPERACNKAPRCAKDYQDKISGPLLDRIDIYIDVPELSPQDIFSARSAENSETVKQRVVKARMIQETRYKNMGLAIDINARLTGDILYDIALTEPECKSLLESATSSLKLSMRGIAKTLRLARTIADLEECDIVNKQHLCEALSYRTTMR